jgi:hypothetical protein
VNKDVARSVFRCEITHVNKTLVNVRRKIQQTSVLLGDPVPHPLQVVRQLVLSRDLRHLGEHEEAHARMRVQEDDGVVAPLVERVRQPPQVLRRSAAEEMGLNMRRERRFLARKC